MFGITANGVRDEPKGFFKRHRRHQHSNTPTTPEEVVAQRQASIVKARAYQASMTNRGFMR